MAKLNKEKTNTEDMTKQVMSILETGREELPTIPKKEKRSIFNKNERATTTKTKCERQKQFQSIQNPKLEI